MNKKTYRDNPEWTKADFEKAKPAKEILSDNVLASFTNTRGVQKAPTKVPISIRLSQEVVDFYKATGKGWQSRINDDLKKASGV